MTLVEFLRARLDEDQRTALEATAGPWSVDDENYAETIYGPGHVVVVAGGRWGSEASVFESTDDALHIARHDPARVLAEVEAKRRITDELLWLEGNANNEPVVADYCAPIILRLLALPYADHSDYDSAWRP